MNEYIEEKTTNLALILFSIFLWIVGLSYGSGIGMAYNIYGKTEIVVVGVSIIVFLKRKSLYLSKGSVIALWGLLVCNIVAYMKNNQTYCSYLWLFLIVYIYSTNKVSKKDLKLIGTIYGVLGVGILMVANYTGILSGWDGNSISMIGFFSYTVFCAGVLDEYRIIRKLLFLAYSFYYFYLLSVLDSRSSILFSIILVLSISGIVPLKKALEKKNIVILLILPLLIALLVVAIKDKAFIEQLNIWSYKTFQKPIFNGRDTIWYNACINFLKNPIFGTGTLAGNWHNSAMTALSGAGIMGYSIFLTFIKKCWICGCEFINDYRVFTILVAFVVVWLQQSVELGIIQPQANPILFVIMGLLLARVNTVVVLNG